MDNAVKVLIALLDKIIDAEESCDGEFRAIYGNVAKMIVDGSYVYEPEIEEKLDMLVAMAYKKGYRGGYKNRF